MTANRYAGDLVAVKEEVVDSGARAVDSNIDTFLKPAWMVLSTIWTPGRVVASSYGLSEKTGSFVISVASIVPVSWPFPY